MSEEIRERAYREEQAKRDREQRMRDIQDKGRSAHRLSCLIANLDTTIKKLNSGEGFFKVQGSNPHTQWEYFAGLDDIHDAQEIRRLVAGYAWKKMQQAEEEFDKL